MASRFLDMLGVGMDDDSMLYDMDGIDPESQMAMIEAMHGGDGPGERMVDGDFFKEFQDDFDDDDLQ